MEKLRMHSPDFTDQNTARIAELFPNCVTESRDDKGKVKQAIDFDQLRQELLGNIVEGPQERYQLNWPGKREALLTANAPIAKTLRPCRQESVDFDITKNIFIEGDNLDALKLLQETYLGKVKMIYIDPPYNTGNDFIYEDDFAEDKDSYFERSMQVDEEGNRLIANTDSNGRFHSDWLTMMYARLRLAKNLMRDDGLIVVSIDDGEYQNLRKICDEVFGEANFIDNIIWKKRYGGGAKEKYLVSYHEYALVFAKEESALANFYIPLSEDSIKRYYTQKDKHYNKRGPYRTHPLEATKSMGERTNLVFPIPGPDGKNINPKRQWLWGKDRVADALAKDELEFIRAGDGTYSVHTKQYLKDENGERRKAKPTSIIDDVFTQHGTNEIIELFGNAQIFSFPKPSLFIKKLIDFATSGNPGEIVLDFFSGSASTAHAVFLANAEDDGHRQFILVQLPEQLNEESEAYRTGFKAISDIGKERIRRAGKRVRDSAGLNGVNLDIGFRVLKVDTSNLKDVYYSPDAATQANLLDQVGNIKEDRSSEDLLFQVMLDWGVDLALPIACEKIGGKEVFFVGGNAIAACFDTGINEDYVKTLAERHPLRVVFRDSGFESDALKINVEQIFKLISPETEVRFL
jgi:adenine-specific DNA-methyltransferase